MLTRSRLIKISSLMLFMCWIVSGVFIYFQIVDVIKPFRVPLGLVDSEKYQTTQLLYFPTFNYANTHLGNSDKILLVGEQRTYHLHIPFVSTSFFSPSVLAYIDANKNSKEVELELIRQGFTHVIINEPEVTRLGGAEKLGMSIDRYKAFVEYLNKEKLLHSENNVHLFVLNSKA